MAVSRAKSLKKLLGTGSMTYPEILVVMGGTINSVQSAIAELKASGEIVNTMNGRSPNLYAVAKPAPMAPHAADRLAAIKARCEEVADCWIWQGAAPNGYPQTKIAGKVSLVRRVVCEIDGRAPAPMQPVAARCWERLCCNPAHLFCSSTAAIAQAAAARGAYSSLARSAKVAAGKRAKGKLTMEKVQEIRLSAEPSKVLAPIYGVDSSLINRVRAHKAWKDYSSPFAGLGQRAERRVA